MMTNAKLQVCIILGIAMIAGIISVALIQQGDTGLAAENALKKFSSVEEIRAYLKANAEQSGYSPPFWASGAVKTTSQSSRDAMNGEANGAAFPMPAAALSPTYAGDYSTTNVQVKGVDEADFVKNDGKYIYMIAGTKLVIVDAYPAEDAKIVSETHLSRQPVEMYLQGDRLVVFSTGAENVYIKPKQSVTPIPYYRDVTFADIYSVRDRAKPELLRTINTSGNYYDSRMIGDYVYAITSESVNWYNDDIVMPEVRDGEKVPVSPDVYYFDIPYCCYSFHTLSSFNIKNDEPVNAETFMLGYTTTLYVSKENLYMAYQFTSPVRPMPGPIPLAAEQRVQETDRSIIHRFAIRNGDISYVGMGEIAGHLLNQFSMDEQNGNLRVATTVQGYSPSGSYQYSTVSVLNPEMKTIGTLEYIAPEEQIYAARFVGDRLYLVTFKRMDPFFVIDLSNPERPGILGKLKIPGFSDYLHPYDETHIIGIGKETGENQWGGVSVEGLKLALFDVTDVNNPTLIDQVEIGESGTDSEALREHKAFLFDKQKNLLVIPVREVKQVPYTDGKYASYGQKIWQGAYVFGVTPKDGFTLRGTISHNENDEPTYYWDSPSAVRRSLYMDDVLYTISSRKIVMNDVNDISDRINEVALPYTSYGYYPVMYR
jgi:inhibitor of cysteine peptidase